MKRIFARAILFLLAILFLFGNAAFLTHELNLAVTLGLLAALVISYLPLKVEKPDWRRIVPGVALMAAAVAIMPMSEFLRGGGLALFMLALAMLLKGLGREAPELPLFSLTAGAYGVYDFVYRTSPPIWAFVKAVSIGFSKFAGWLASALPGPKAVLGPAFMGTGIIVTFALFLILATLFLQRGRRLQRLGVALGMMVVIAAAYVVVFTYLPKAFEYQLKIGPVPSEAEKNTTQQTIDQGRDPGRTESEKATKVVLSGDSFTLDKCPLWATALLAAAFMVPVWFFLRKAEFGALPPIGTRRFAVLGVAVLLLLAVFQSEDLRVPSREALAKCVAGKRVAFYYHGFSNWVRPDFNSFGSRSSGMFGNLPDFVESMGFKQPVPPTRDDKGYLKAGVLLTEITPETLKGVDVLMLLNPDDTFNHEDPPAGVEMSKDQQARKTAFDECKTDEEKKQLMLSWHRDALRLIWKFVADGGSLLVIGDHTFLKEVTFPGGEKVAKLWLNDLFAPKPFHIRFMNDSAKYFVGGWLQSMENPAHPLTYGLPDDQNEVGMVVGASLGVTSPARPVIVGKYGFLDPGDLREGPRGYLGNLEFDMGEELGQIVIAAEQAYGRGRVLVFGDTSAFANGIITNTGEFCNRVFTWLALNARDKRPELTAGLESFDPERVSPSSNAPMTLLTLVLLAVAGVAFVYAGGWQGLPIAAVIMGVIAASPNPDITVRFGPGLGRTPRDAGAIRVAYIDEYHMPRISKEGWRDDGVMGLHLNLMRNGFYSLNLKTFDLDTLRRAAVVVIVAPTKEISARDVDVIKAYISGGGTVILTAGYEEISCTRRLLKAFDLEIPYVPLGRFKLPVQEAGGRNVPFWRIWPIEFTGHKTPVDGKEPFHVIIPYEPVDQSRTLAVPVLDTLTVSGTAVAVKVDDAAAAEAVELIFEADAQLKGLVNVGVDDSKLTLAGQVPSDELLRKAGELAAMVSGLPVVNSLATTRTGTPSLAPRTLAEMKGELEAKLKADPVLRAERISVSESGDKLVLGGTVSSEAARRRAGALATTVASRTKVYNLAGVRAYGAGNLIVIPDSGFWTNKNLEIEKMGELAPEQKENYMQSIEFMHWLLTVYVSQAKAAIPGEPAKNASVNKENQ